MAVVFAATQDEGQKQANGLNFFPRSSGQIIASSPIGCTTKSWMKVVAWGIPFPPDLGINNLPRNPARFIFNGGIAMPLCVCTADGRSRGSFSAS